MAGPKGKHDVLKLNFDRGSEAYLPKGAQSQRVEAVASSKDPLRKGLSRD